MEYISCTDYYCQPEASKPSETCHRCGSSFVGSHRISRIDRNGQSYWAISYECGAVMQAPVDPSDRRLRWSPIAPK